MMFYNFNNILFQIVEMLRYRGKKLALNIVKELDSFPKVQEEIYEPSTYRSVICKIYLNYLS